jgi:hypothetical protein
MIIGIKKEIRHNVGRNRPRAHARKISIKKADSQTLDLSGYAVAARPKPPSAAGSGQGQGVAKHVERNVDLIIKTLSPGARSHRGAAGCW